MRARHLAWPGAVDGQTAIKIARIRLSDCIGLALARRLIETEGGQLRLAHPGPCPRFEIVLTI